MKIVPFVFLLLLVFASCNNDKDKKFDVVLEHRFTVKIDYTDTDITWSASEVLDAAGSSGDFNRYKNGIRNVSVTGAFFEIQNVATPDVKFQLGVLAYSKSTENTYDKATQSAKLDIDNGNLKTLENHEQKLQFSDVSLIEMSNTLSSSKVLNVYLDGRMPATPAKFDVVFRIKATVTASDL